MAYVYSLVAIIVDSKIECYLVPEKVRLLTTSGISSISSNVGLKLFMEALSSVMGELQKGLGEKLAARVSLCMLINSSFQLL